MKKNFKKAFIVALVFFILCITPLSINASAATGGTCGENITWEFDSSTGTLTISGTGSAFYSFPWEEFRTTIKHIVISDGITHIPPDAFANFSEDKPTAVNTDSLVSVSIPDSVTYIGQCAFFGCNSLKTIDLPDNIQYIGDYAFQCCTALENIEFPENATFGRGVYYYMMSLESVIIPSRFIKTPASMFNMSLGLKNITIENGVETISSYTFGFCENIETIILPKSLKTIESCAFILKDEDFTPIDIYYEGSEEDWELIQIDGNNQNLLDITIHYNYVPEVPETSEDLFAADEGDNIFTTGNSSSSADDFPWGVVVFGIAIVCIFGIAAVAAVVIVIILKKKK